MLNNQQSLLMARRLCAMASDRYCNVEEFENLISRLRKQNIVYYTFSVTAGAYECTVNSQKARVYL